MNESTVQLPSLPKRDPKGHKGTFGTVAVIGGCAHAPAEAQNGLHMIGGPALCAVASLRAGAGLCRLVMPAPILDAGLTIAESATGLALPVDDSGDIVPHLAAPAIDRAIAGSACVAVGPGLAVSPGARSLVLRCIVQESTPLVIDADALNNLCDIPEVQRDFRAPAVLTPHIGEFDRLAAALEGIPAVKGHAETAPHAKALAQRLGCIVVLKSAATVVTDGHRTWRHDEPNPVLGTAGSGDVLTGLIAGLIAQFFKPALGAGSTTITSERQGGLGLFDCAAIAVAAHARAARTWAHDHQATGGLLAWELTESIPGILEAMRG